ARVFAREIQYPDIQIAQSESLYFLGAGSIEALIAEQENTMTSIMLVFHNPDITGFSNSLDYEFHIDNVPTCGLLKYACDIESWADWSASSARFEYYDYPKNPSDRVVEI
ncbi:MAG: hypothetical protein AAF353_16620, partial [Pseudomonadota bacterium]